MLDTSATMDRGHKANIAEARALLAPPELPYEAGRPWDRDYIVIQTQLYRSVYRRLLYIESHAHRRIGYRSTTGTGDRLSIEGDDFDVPVDRRYSHSGWSRAYDRLNQILFRSGIWKGSGYENFHFEYVLVVFGPPKNTATFLITT